MTNLRLLCLSDKIEETVSGETVMAKQIEILSETEKTPVFMQRLRVAAYCRVSTKQEEQRYSLEAQELYYGQIISRNPF